MNQPPSVMAGVPTSRISVVSRESNSTSLPVRLLGNGDSASVDLIPVLMPVFDAWGQLLVWVDHVP